MKPKPVLTATFRGIRYDVDIAHVLDGYVDLPGEPDRRVLHINGNLGPRDFLETAVHEALHATLNSDDEAVVEPAAREVSRFLWRLGYRRKP